MLVPQQGLSLGFSSTEAFWSQAGVFVSEYPHRIGSWTNIPKEDALSPDRLLGFQDKLFQTTLRRVDLSECLAWQRQFSILGRVPTILSRTSLLGRFQELPEPQQEAVRDLAGFYLREKPQGLDEASSSFVRRRMAQLEQEAKVEEARLYTRASGILGKTGPDLSLLALEVYHEDALLHCNYPEALLAAFWLYGYQDGLNKEDLPKNLQRELLLRIAFSNGADALSKGHLDRAATIIGYSLANIDDLARSRFLEINAWFADQMAPLIGGVTYDDLKEKIVLPWKQHLSRPSDLRYIVLGVGFALLMNDQSRHEEFWPRLKRDFPA